MEINLVSEKKYIPNRYKSLSYYLRNNRYVLSYHYPGKKVLSLQYTSRRYEGLKFITSFNQKLIMGRRINDAYCKLDYQQGNSELEVKYSINNKLKLKGFYDIGKWLPNLGLISSLKTMPTETQISNGCLFHRSRYYAKAQHAYHHKQAEKNEHLMLFTVDGIAYTSDDKEFGLGQKFTYRFGDSGFRKVQTYLSLNRPYDSLIFKQYLLTLLSLCYAHKIYSKMPQLEFGLGSMSVYLFKKISNELLIASQLKHDFVNAKKRKIQFGLNYYHANNFQINAKIDDKMQLQACFLIKLTNMVRLNISTNYKLDISETTTTGLPFSIKLHLSDDPLNL